MISSDNSGYESKIQDKDAKTSLPSYLIRTLEKPIELKCLHHNTR